MTNLQVFQNTEFGLLRAIEINGTLKGQQYFINHYLKSGFKEKNNNRR